MNYDWKITYIWPIETIENKENLLQKISFVLENETKKQSICVDLFEDKMQLICNHWVWDLVSVQLVFKKMRYTKTQKYYTTITSSKIDPQNI
jgi:hypothetical protein